jgi:predicted DNA-binding antitoxin AbrB/MazE fold protein
MELSIEATYEDGVLKPASPLPLAEHERVRVVIHPTTTWARRTAGILKWTGDLIYHFIGHLQFGLPCTALLDRVVAVMQTNGLTNLASNDSDFDRVPWITRFAPA